MFVEANIPLDKVSRLEARIDQLNKRAKKRKVSPFEIEVGGSFLKPITDYYGNTFSINFVKVKVSGELPKVPGYKFLGFKTVKDGLPFITGDIPEEFRDIENPKCCHCNTARNRNDYAVVEKDGVICTLGKNCFEACFSDEDAKNLLHQFSGYTIIYDELSEIEGEGSCGAGHGEFIPSRFLSYVAMIAESNRFVSAAESAELGMAPTWCVAKDLYQSTSGATPSDADVLKAKNAIEYFKSLSSIGSSFVFNVKTRLMAEVVTSESLALIASAFGVYEKHINEKVRSSMNPASSSKYVGEIKDRIDLQLTILFMFQSDSFYGIKTSYVFADDEGNRFFWRTSSCLSGEYEKTNVCPEKGPYTATERFKAKVGDKVKVKATVSKHEPYERNGKSIETTHINRLKLLSFFNNDEETII